MPDGRRVIDSKKLQAFYYVAKLGSLSRAQAVLMVAQPAISRSLSRLEQDLGVKLLERHGRGVALTPIGEILYEQAETILREMEESIQRIDRAKRKPSKRVRISASAIVMSLFMPEVLNRMIALDPSTQIVAVQSPSGEVYNSLLSGQVDVAIVMQVPNRQKFFMQKIFEEPMILITSKTRPEASLGAIKRNALATLPIILPATQNGMRGIIEDYAKTGNIALSPHLQIDSVPLIKRMLSTGNFCAIMPHTTFGAEFDKRHFVGLPLIPKLSRTLYAAAHKGVNEEDHVRILLKIIEQVFSEYRPRGAS